MREAKRGRGAQKGGTLMLARFAPKMPAVSETKMLRLGCQPGHKL